MTLLLIGGINVLLLADSDYVMFSKSTIDYVVDLVIKQFGTFADVGLWIFIIVLSIFLTINIIRYCVGHDY